MSKTPTIYFADAGYDDQFLRTLAASYAGMTDLGEAFAAARAIGRHATPDTWYDGWIDMARSVDQSAAEAERAGHTVTARSAYLRATEYYRQAFFFIRHLLDDERLQDAYAAHARCFAAAAPGLDLAAADAVEIPYEDTTLHGWFFTPHDAKPGRATVIMPDGYDSTAEEGLQYVLGALARGYNVLTFDGPGVGRGLFVQKLYMRPDYEAVITPIVDWLSTRDDVDPTKIVLLGRSFAGYLGPRAAAFEHRIAALVCDPPDPNLASHIPGGVVGRVAAPAMTMLSSLDADKKEFFGARMATHGIHDMATYLETLHEFNMLSVADKIICPTLLVECEGDELAGSQGADALSAVMTAQTTHVTLSAASGAGGHCGGLGQRVWDGVVYDWLDDILR